MVELAPGPATVELVVRETGVVEGTPVKFGPGTTMRSCLVASAGPEPAEPPPPRLALTVKAVVTEGRGANPPIVTATAWPAARSTLLVSVWVPPCSDGAIAAVTVTPLSLTVLALATTTVTDNELAGESTSTPLETLKARGCVETASIEIPLRGPEARSARSRLLNAVRLLGPKGPLPSAHREEGKPCADLGMLLTNRA